MDKNILHTVHVCWLTVLSLFLFFGITFADTQNSVIKNQSMVFTGVTEAVHDVVLGLPVEGTIDKIFFQEGDWVKKGQAILHLKRRGEELEVELRELLWKNTARLDAARIEEQKFESLFIATKRLFEKTQSVSEEELTKLELRYFQAHYKRKELEGLQKQQYIEYDLALELLKRMSIYAPISGIITEIILDEGEQYKPNEPLIHLVDPRECHFVCNVEERFGRALRPGQQVKLRIQAGTKKINKKGKLVFVSPVVDPASGLLKVKARFDNREMTINPGISGKILFHP